MKAVTSLLVASCLLLSACSNSGDNEPPQQATAAHAPARVEMADLAANNCLNAGGTLALSRQLDGSAVGMCQLKNGRRCSEGALLNGSCAR
ncbi:MULTISPECIES: DUF333 domain-containing protein [Erwinia]|uniref:putative hemolysin n=1 Tax=Erwinia pyrifoliae TaxID=79967 RepID=UPI0001960DF4|nr:MULTISPECIES: DUF333 domain-containing protein [Erwinia]ADP12646.1 conserved uncharacterized protein YdbJ [Erwinia sp. Ejp617]AUX72785.1 DUF333 domain-containing protein [Erwinia pyrifoliae]MCA8876952.1 DUF333 domain-containing protein [Erwinia pyrifoliae]MCT2387103.1 DUF333 domain-containing protein [Erwinia pyrifoliae]MCU8587298.1 DUF333 domain-containing protein [Erwinia pyrifoliae]